LLSSRSISEKSTLELCTRLTILYSPSDFYEIMDMLDKRLNDKGKNWRHVLKSLKVLDYCLHEGSELVVTWARKNVYIIKTLREFQYIDEDGRDVGQNGMCVAMDMEEAPC
jgi:epsin